MQKYTNPMLLSCFDFNLPCTPRESPLNPSYCGAYYPRLPWYPMRQEQRCPLCYVSERNTWRIPCIYNDPQPGRMKGSRVLNKGICLDIMRRKGVLVLEFLSQDSQER
jgi:hypothetical protein